MNQPKFCTECKWSKPDKDFHVELRCLNPHVNSKDAWALAATEIRGSSCHSERQKGFFEPCGKRGKLWQQK